MPRVNTTSEWSRMKAFSTIATAVAIIGAIWGLAEIRFRQLEHNVDSNSEHIHELRSVASSNEARIIALERDVDRLFKNKIDEE